jgi:hypothetical protein
MWQSGNGVGSSGQCIFDGRTDVTAAASAIRYSVLVTSGGVFQQVPSLVSVLPICVLQTFLWINCLIFYRSKCVCGLLACTSISAVSVERLFLEFSPSLRICESGKHLGCPLNILLARWLSTFLILALERYRSDATFVLYRILFGYAVA